jgi:hypothetical protein
MSAIAIGVGLAVGGGLAVASVGAATAMGVAGTAILGGVAAAGVAGSAMSSSRAASAAKQAAATQAAAQGNAIEAQNAQFQQIQELLKPYITAGKPDLTQPYIQAGPGALQGMQGLAGLRGNAEQQAAIEQIKQGAQFQELAKQGEQGILQNASATGGLRGGNVQAALGQFRPALLNQLIESQYGKLAGLTSLGSSSAQNLLGIGQASAAGTAAAGQQSAQNIGNLMVGQGAAQAAGQIGQANAYAQGASGISNAVQGGVQNYMLMNAVNKGVFGGTASTASLLGTGGFYPTNVAASNATGGANIGYLAPTATTAGGYYPTGG